jgi:hypothetical protein
MVCHTCQAEHRMRVLNAAEWVPEPNMTTPTVLA